MERISHPRRNLLKLNIHFVWATKERLPLILPEYEPRLYRYIGSVFDRYEGRVLAIGGMPTPVHVQVALSPKYSVSEVMKNVKGSSSRFMTETLAPDSFFQWQPNYAAIAVSPGHVEAVRTYIDQQKEHHAEGSVRTLWEHTDEMTDGEVAAIGHDS